MGLVAMCIAVTPVGAKAGDSYDDVVSCEESSFVIRESANAPKFQVHGSDITLHDSYQGRVERMPGLVIATETGAYKRRLVLIPDIAAVDLHVLEQIDARPRVSYLFLDVRDANKAERALNALHPGFAVILLNSDSAGGRAFLAKHPAERQSKTSVVITTTAYPDVPQVVVPMSDSGKCPEPGGTSSCGGCSVESRSGNVLVAMLVGLALVIRRRHRS